MAATHRVVALNIGTANIVAVQAKVTDGGSPGQRSAVIEKIATVRTPEGAIRSNGVHRPEALTDTLKELWRGHGLQTKNVIVGVDSRRLQSGVQWIEYYSPADLARAARADWVNAKKITPVPVDPKNSEVHHFALRERVAVDQTTQREDREILLLAIDVPKQETQAIANVVEDAGLEMIGMDLTALGLLRGASLRRSEDKRVVDMLVDIGKTYVTMVLHNSGNLRSVATVTGAAGAEVTRAISDVLSTMSKDYVKGSTDAESVKLALANSVQQTPDDPVTRRAVDAVNKQAADLVSELNTFVSRYIDSVNGLEGNAPRSVETNREERGLASISLTGGGSFLYGLAERLKDPEAGGFPIMIHQAAVSPAFKMQDGGPVPHVFDGISIVSTVGLLTADRKAV